MKLSRVAVFTGLVGLTTVWISGCCATKGISHHGPPEISQQPDDTMTSTNSKSTASICVGMRDAHDYDFTWFKEVVVTNCNREGENAILTYQLARFAGNTNETLVITDAQPSDTGDYFCLVRRKDCDEPYDPENPCGLQTRTRSTYLEVYATPDVFHNGHRIREMRISYPMTQLTLARNIPGSGTGSKNACNFVANACQPFNADDQAKYFICPPGMHGAALSAFKNGQALTTQDFNVDYASFGSNVYKCATNGATGTELSCSATAGTRYVFRLYLKNAGNFSYQLKVTWQ